MRTQVVIIGAGPAGLLLGRLLSQSGVEAVILERKSAEYVVSRIRAGVLEQGSADLLKRAGLGARMSDEGLPHDGIEIGFDGDPLHINFFERTGSRVVVYGQTEVTRDLMEARHASGEKTIYEAENVSLSRFDTTRPRVSWQKDGKACTIDCDFIVGCDGYHGVSRASVPEQAISQFVRNYPFGWLGILVDQPPVSNELIYAHHSRGFALCSMRSMTRSRYYVQVPEGEQVDHWSDQRFWDELRMRIPPEAAERLQTGDSIEKSIAPLRSFVAEPLRFGSLFLAGDAAHIVPPTGAKGLNLAISDVALLADALTEFYDERSDAGLNSYSEKALARIWRAERFSWWMTSLLHTFPDSGTFGRRIQRADFDYLGASKSAQISLAENYCGLDLS